MHATQKIQDISNGKPEVAKTLTMRDLRGIDQIFFLLSLFAISVIASPLTVPAGHLPRPTRIVPYNWAMMHMNTDDACSDLYPGSVSELVNHSIEDFGLDYHCRLPGHPLYGPFIMFCIRITPPRYIPTVIHAPTPDNPNNTKGECVREPLAGDAPEANHKVFGNTPVSQVHQNPSAASGLHSSVDTVVHAGSTACIDSPSASQKYHTLEAYVTSSDSSRDVYADYISWYEVLPSSRLINRQSMVGVSTINAAVVGGIYRACAAAWAGADNLILHVTASSISYT